jgi:flagellar assembly factor FliW
LKLGTKYFGQIEYETEDIIAVDHGLFGFETEKEFLLLPFEGSGGNMLCLQSVKTEGLAFVVVNPLSLCPDYDPALQPEELASLGVKHSHDLAYYALCAVKKPVAQSTVNLKCPLAVEPQSRKAQQVILESEQYQMRHLLSEFHQGEGEHPC